MRSKIVGTIVDSCPDGLCEFNASGGRGGSGELRKPAASQIGDRLLF
jgi:hypothetical protein